MSFTAMSYYEETDHYRLQTNVSETRARLASGDTAEFPLFPERVLSTKSKGGERGAN